MKNYQNKNLALVSVIIPCRNEEKFIAECLDSVIQQDYPKEKIEVLVVDGASEDKTKKIVKNYSKKYPFVKLLNNPKKIKPVALNIGIKKSKGEYIIIMDAHSKYKNNYISKCVETAVKYNADNVGGILKTISKNNNFISKSITKCLLSSFGVGGAFFRKGLKKITEVDTVFGGCYKKEVFKKINLFNEKLIRSQDMEFNIRLKKAGGKILLNPEIISYYYPKSTLKEFFKHNILDGIWAIYPTKIANIPLKLRHYIPLLFVLSLLFTLLLSIFFPLFMYLFIFILGIYLITSLYFSIKIALEEKSIEYLFLMPIVFACRHFGYGIGSLWGILTCWRIKK
jgi:glycosyltransferase involved in cell wall biosynthesis